MDLIKEYYVKNLSNLPEEKRRTIATNLYLKTTNRQLKKDNWSTSLNQQNFFIEYAKDRKINVIYNFKDSKVIFWIELADEDVTSFKLKFLR